MGNIDEPVFYYDKFNLVSMLDTDPAIMELYKHIPELEEKDNRGYTIHRPLFSHSSLPDKLGGKVETYDSFTFHCDFIYPMLVHHNTELWVKHINVIPNNILTLVRKGICKLIFDDTLEGNPIENVLETFYKSIEDLNLPPEGIFYVTNNLLAENTHEEFLKQNPKEDKINIISYMYNVADVHRIIKETGCLPNSVSIDKEIEYKKEKIDIVRPFLKVNRTNREERNIAMLFLTKNNLLDNFYISFPEYDSSIREYNHNFKHLADKETIEKLKQLCPFDIDDTDKTNHGPPGLGKGFFDADLPFQPIHYRNSLISFVMCAFPFVDNAIHLHSSTYNPIYCGHPIVQFGPYQALRELRARGFKTFGKWWDESYDEEKNHWKRLKKVLKLIEELNCKSKEELLDMYIDMKDVLQHNTDLIQNTTITEELKSKIFDEY